MTRKNLNGNIKKFFSLVILFTIGVSDLLAQDLPAYCEEDTNYRNQLKNLGPVVAVVASGSSGLMAKSTIFPFYDNIEIVKKESDYAEAFDVTDPYLVESAGNNPLVLNIKRVTKDGGIVLTDKQLSVIRKVAEDPRNQLSGGVLITLKKVAVQ